MPPWAFTSSQWTRRSAGPTTWRCARPVSAWPEDAANSSGFSALRLCFCVLLSFVVPLWFGAGDFERYLGNALFLLACLFTNYWSFDLQSTAWSADLGRPFAFISIIRRVAFLGALGLFWMSGNFLLFGLATTVIIAVFMVILIRMVRRSPAMAAARRRATPAGFASYWKQFSASLVFALSELLVLNSPYAILTALFGVGPVLVMFDSVMKLCRLAMAGTRTLAEVFLPRISRHLLAGELHPARKGLWRVTLLCVGASAIPAVAVFFFAPQIFNLLLGPNNVVPPAAAPAAALIVLVSGFYQPATIFLSFLNARRLILKVAQFACVGAAVCASVMILGHWQPAQLLWIYAAFFGSVSLFAVLCSARIEPWDAAEPA